MSKQNLMPGETRTQRAARQQREQDAQFDSHILLVTSCNHLYARLTKDGLMYCKNCDNYVEKWPQ